MVHSQTVDAKVMISKGSGIIGDEIGASRGTSRSGIDTSSPISAERHVEDDLMIIEMRGNRA